MIVFEEMLRAAKALDGSQIEIASGVVADSQGCIDRECPNEICEFKFKVHHDDWREIVRDEEVFCPSCRHGADSSKWFTQEQVAYQRQQALAHFATTMNRAMRVDAEAWNRRQPRNSFVRITMQVGETTRELHVPATVSDPMRFQIGCPACSCRYAVIGAAYFCPACGHNSADMMFKQTLNGIRTSLDALAQVQPALADLDTAKFMTQALIEASLQSLVSAFQRYVERLYESQPNAPKVRRNLFQNLAQGSEAWRKVFDNPYASHLSAEELRTLSTFLQQRHLLAHRQGLVDEDYLRNSGDRTYSVGQRIIVKAADVREAARIVERLCAGLAGDALIRSQA